MKVTICVLVAQGFPVPAEFLKAYSLLQQHVLQGLGNELLPEERRIDAVRILFESNFPVDFGRNHATAAFLDAQDGGDYLLFLDADMAHPPMLLHRLIKHDLDVVTARYVMRKPPFFTVAMRKVGDGPEEYQALEKLMDPEQVRGLLPIDAGGAGALLISRRCLETIRSRVGDDWFRYQNGAAGLRSRSEDMWFYEQAKAAGFQPFLDADTECGHIGQFLLDQTFHKPYHDAYGRHTASEITGAPA